jgi:hypothetical protein
MTNDERVLRDVIEGSMAGVAAPTSRLAAAAVERGRRLRRRRRAATVVGAAALAAVVGVGIPQAIGSDGGDRSSGPGFAGSTGGPVQTEMSPDPPPGWWSMPAGEMADHVKDMLPRGTRIVAMRTRSEEPGDDKREWRGFLVAHIDTPASSGPGGINLHVGMPNTPEPGTRPTGPVSVGADAPVAAANRQDLRCTSYGEELTSCEVLRDEQGRRIGRLSRLDLGDVVLLSATMCTTDGGTVSIDASNSTDDKWGVGSSTTADEPPLTLRQLREIVADPVWTSYRP